MKQDPSLIVSEDVEGAPVRIGGRVKIVDASDDGSFSLRFLGRTGVVVGLVYDDPANQYPAEPLIQVHVQGLGEDLFFAQELQLLPTPEPRALGEVAAEVVLAREPWQ
jgi:CarS bacterial SH3 domain